MFDDRIVKELLEKLDPKRIKARSQAGRSLSYLEGWDVIEKANALFGFGNWGYEVHRPECVGSESFEKNGKTGYRVGYIALATVTVLDGPSFSDVGYGNDISYNSVIDAHELAAKEAGTDAVKRCLKNYGNQFGLCLYDKLQEGVDDGKPAAVAPKVQSPAAAPTPTEVAEEDTQPPAKTGPTPATENEVAELYAALKELGKTPQEISAIFEDNAKQNNGINPSAWVQRQHSNVFFALEKKRKETEGK